MITYDRDCYLSLGGGGGGGGGAVAALVFRLSLVQQGIHHGRVLILTFIALTTLPLSSGGG